ncbi:MAG: hypothetical protein ABSA45_02020 [Verrucomicrobiota bacterium]
MPERKTGLRKDWCDFCWTRIFMASKVKSMKQTKKRWNPILWVEAVGFSLLILLSWLTEAIRIPYLIFGEPFVGNWHRALLRTVVVLLVWLWVHLATRRLLKRLHHLEEFLRICGWCRKVCHEGEWLAMEDYFTSKFATRTSHGMCPECMKKGVDELKLRENPSSIPEQ